MYGHSRGEVVLSTSHAMQGNFSLMGLKNERWSAEDQLAEWGPEVCLRTLKNWV